MPGHVRQLELELEIRHGAQAAHHDLHTELAREIHREAGVTHDLDTRNVAQHLARQLDPLFERKHRRLVRVRGDRDDHAFEHAGGTAHQVLVAVGDWIEGSGIDGAAFHVANR